MSHEALEAIFVQREALAAQILQRLRDTILTGARQHTLLVGPRGIGKTHLISLTYYRLRAMAELRDRFLTAWLLEEEWGVTCFRDLLLRIIRSLRSEDPDDAAFRNTVARIHALALEQAEIVATRSIRELVGNRTLVILVENLDDLFQRLGPGGQRRLYQFFQENPFCCVVATTPGAIVVPPKSPFARGFFNVHQLEELSFEDALRLVARIARYDGDEQLASFLTTARGRARMRALRHLAGGSHRAYVVFSRLLARESLDDLLEPLMRTIDDLTPYYQSRLASLDAEQRKVVEYLCETRHPAAAADVARVCFLTYSVASERLEGLCKIGYLQPLRVNHQQYYELREPLMRVSIEVKKHRDRPIALLLDLLRLWYLPSELKQRLSLLPPEARLEREYGLPAVQALEGDWEDPRVTECSRDYNAALRREDHERAAQAAEELVAIRGSVQDLAAYASCLLHLNRFDDAAIQLDRLVALDERDAAAWRLRAAALYQAGRSEEALASCQRSLELAADSSRTWSARAEILIALGRAEEAVLSADRAVELAPTDASACAARAVALAHLGRLNEAASALEHATDSGPGGAWSRMRLGAALLELKQPEQGLAHLQRSVELDPRMGEAWALRGTALAALGRRGDALASVDQATARGHDSAGVHFKRAELLFWSGRWREGVASLDLALSRNSDAQRPLAGDTSSLIRALVPCLASPAVLQLSIKMLLLVYRKHGRLSALGQGLIECISDIASPELFDDAGASFWSNSWKAVAEPFPEFRLALRLLDYAVRFRQTHDECVLMQLPLEERAFLESLLGIQVSATA
jgi:tetratricopeptide (TPR) repeat protein